jgi:nucleotide-binding universal stress UspA family protein
MKATSVAAGARLSSNRGPRAGAKPIGRGRTVGRIRLLVVIDATEASRRVLQYISRILTGRDEVDICLAYLTAGLPPALLETGGAELPRREEQIEAHMRSDQRRWMAAGDKKAERILHGARATLLRGGIAESTIRTCVSSPLDARQAADEVLLLARDQQCRTVVVGHRAHTWFRGLGGGHLAEQLVRRAKGYAVWVID